MIESYAFQGTSITSLYLPASLKYVGFAAFNECKLLTSLTMANEGNDIIFDQWAFARVGLTEVNIKKRIVVIGYACFAFASDVEQVNISAEGNTLTVTGCEVFFAANKINSVILPTRVATLPEEDDDPENGRAFALNQNATRV